MAYYESCTCYAGWRGTGRRALCKPHHSRRPPGTPSHSVATCSVWPSFTAGHHARGTHNRAPPSATPLAAPPARCTTHHRHQGHAPPSTSATPCLRRRCIVHRPTRRGPARPAPPAPPPSSSSTSPRRATPRRAPPRRLPARRHTHTHDRVHIIDHIAHDLAVTDNGGEGYDYYPPITHRRVCARQPRAARYPDRRRRTTRRRPPAAVPKHTCTCTRSRRLGAAMRTHACAVQDGRLACSAPCYVTAATSQRVTATTAHGRGGGGY